VNAKGEQFFRDLLAQTGRSARQIDALWKVRCTKAQDNFRRSLRYFVDYCKALHVDPLRIHTYHKAEHTLTEAMQRMFDSNKHSVRVIADMKTAVSILFGLRLTRKPILAEDRVVKTLLRSYNHQRPLLKKTLHLPYTHKQYKDGAKQQPLPAQLSTRMLHGKTIDLLRAMHAVRTTEAAQMDREASDPSPDGSTWTFQLLIKHKGFKQEVTVKRNADIHLDPIAHLLEVRRRARLTKTAATNRFMWLRDNGTLMSENALRNASRDSMKDAGINDKRSYHLKHMAATDLMDKGVHPEKIRSFLRHSRASNALMDNYVDDHNGKECVDILGE
jgi:site-specific recombinase XerD